MNTNSKIMAVNTAFATLLSKIILQYPQCLMLKWNFLFMMSPPDFCFLICHSEKWNYYCGALKMPHFTPVAIRLTSNIRGYIFKIFNHFLLHYFTANMKLFSEVFNQQRNHCRLTFILVLTQIYFFSYSKLVSQ